MPPEKGKRRSKQHLVLLDPDKLGVLVAICVSTLVMALCFFVRDVTAWAEVAVRVGITFVITYLVTFLFVLFLRHVAAQAQEASRRAAATHSDNEAEAPEVPVTDATRSETIGRLE